MTDYSANSGGGGQQSNDNPYGWIRMILAISVALLFLIVIFVAFPMVKFEPGAEAQALVLHQSNSIMVFTAALITGVFVFMAFRIDTGARNLARHEATSTAEQVAESAAAIKAKDVAEKILGDMVRTEVKVYLNGKEGTNVVVDTINKNVKRNLMTLLKEEVKRQLPSELKVQLPTEVKTLLPVEVGNQLGGEVQKHLGQEVGNRLGTEVSSRLGREVSSRLENVVAGALGAVVANQLPAVVADQLPDVVSGTGSAESGD